MSSKSNPVGSGDTSSLHHIPSHEGTISTATGERSAKTLSTTSKCAIVAFVVGGVAGIVIIGLGATNMFGSVGSSGFIGSIAGGGAVAVFSTGGIIWIAIANCKAEQGHSQLSRDNTDSIETHSNIGNARAPLKDKMGKTYPQIGQEAIEFARQKLNEHPDIQPTKFRTLQGVCAGGTNQPVNQEIALLATLYWNVYFAAFEQKIKEHKEENPWSQPDVIQAADDLIKIGYAISCLTLEDLPEFTQALETKGKKRTYAEALTIQDSYQYRTYYSCTSAYHWIRGGIVWIGDDHQATEGYLDYLQETPKIHADPFYQEGTIQSKWRALYNDHCDRIRSYVKESDLQRADNRHFTWTKKDEDTFFRGRTFYHTPDTLPT